MPRGIDTAVSLHHDDVRFARSTMFSMMCAVSDTTALIFTPQMLKAIAAKKPSSTRLLHKTAAAAPLLQKQIERLAREVPENQQARLLGQLRSLSGPDQQLRDAVGELLLASALRATGWSVEHEPEINGSTPDLRISKGARSYVVEIKRVTGVLTPRRNDSDFDIALRRVREALSDLPPTRTPIFVTELSLHRDASLDDFKSELQTTIRSGGQSRVPQTFNRHGVRVTFTWLEPLDHTTPLIWNPQESIASGSEEEPVKRALNQKLGSYDLPLIVALDLFGLGFGFDSVREAMLGTTVWNIPIGFRGDIDTPRVTTARRADSIFSGNAHSAERARERLIATLPFEWGFHGGLNLTAQLVGNPFATEPHEFAEFDPIPRLVVTRVLEDSSHLMFQPAEAAACFKRGEEPLWSYTP